MDSMKSFFKKMVFDVYVFVEGGLDIFVKDL